MSCEGDGEELCADEDDEPCEADDVEPCAGEDDELCEGEDDEPTTGGGGLTGGDGRGGTLATVTSSPSDSMLAGRWYGVCA